MGAGVCLLHTQFVLFFEQRNTSQLHWYVYEESKTNHSDWTLLRDIVVLKGS